MTEKIPAGLFCVDCHASHPELPRPSDACMGNCDGDGPVAEDRAIEEIRARKQRLKRNLQ